MSIDNDHQREFFLEEYRSLRHQIDQYTRDLITLERWALIASGALWSWLATTFDQSNLPAMIYFAPAVVSTLLALRSYGIYQTNSITSKYLAEIEQKFEIPADLGWHKSRSRYRMRSLAFSGYSYWFFLCGLNIALPTWTTLNSMNS